MKYKLKWELPHDATTCLGWLLSARGVEDIEGYVYPSKDYELNPRLLDNIDRGAALLKKHLDNDSNILLVQDCDTDGIMSSAMLWLYIKDFYPNAKLEYVCHEHKQHGLEDIIDDIEESDYDLIILPDASSNDYDYHERLYNAHKDILVIDHHEAEYYSNYAVVINNQLSKDYPNKSFSGAGVVYKFLMVMDELMGEPGHSEKYMDLCALANVADCMSMKHPETRYYIMEGLKRVQNDGFKAFINQQSYSLFKETKELGYIGVAFYIAPLLNAVVRVGTMEEKRLLFESFINPNELIQSDKRGAKPGDMEKVAVEMARRASNARNRQNKTKERATELLDMRVQKYDLLDNKILIIEVDEKDNIPQELRGLICAQFVNRYHRPCAIVARNSEGFLRGSIRGNDSFEEVPDFKAFLEGSGLMDYVQGHANAAGMSIHESNLEDLLAYANTHISDEGLSNVYYVDYIFDESENFGPLLLNIAAQPNLWGNDIEEPMVVVERIPYYREQLFVMGENKDSSKFNHNGVEYVKFKDSDYIQEATAYERGYITVYGSIKQNTWAGRTTPQILIQDYIIEDATYEF